MIDIKYMGSKSRVAKHIVPIIQDRLETYGLNTYIEPFCGGANIVDKVECETKIASDKNKYLIALLKRVQNGQALLEEVPRELYNEIRASFNSGDTSKYEDWLVGNVGFLASFNGRFFDGGYAKSGYEKTKSGLRFRDYYKEAQNNLLKQSKDFRDIEFMCCDYKKWSDVIDCVIYCDPPYQNQKQYANAMDFDYGEFWNWCRAMSERNIVLISELSAPPDFECVWQKEVSRSIKAIDKSKAVERLFEIR